MDRFQEMTVFVAVAEAAGFAAAARRLGVSPPAVTRIVSALEARLGVRLLTRTTRLVRLTEAGARYLEDSRKILAEVADAEASAAGAHGELQGQLTITAPVLFGALYVMPLVTEFTRRHPRLRIHALFLDRVINLIEEGVDLAFRIGELPDSSLTAAAVGRVSQVLCASPDYLAEHGEPRHPDELARHELVATSGGVSPTREWRFQHRGEALAVGIAPRITVTSNDAALTAARLGWGITRLLSYQVAAPVRAGQLRLLLADYTPPPLPVHVVSLEGRRASAKVRGFADFAVARLRADASIN